MGGGGVEGSEDRPNKRERAILKLCRLRYDERGNHCRKHKIPGKEKRSEVGGGPSPNGVISRPFEKELLPGSVLIEKNQIVL